MINKKQDRKALICATMTIAISELNISTARDDNARDVLILGMKKLVDYTFPDEVTPDAFKAEVTKIIEGVMADGKQARDATH